MSSSDNLPTIWDAFWNWLGVQAPVIPLPQTLKNLDKAIGTVVLAGGENITTRIKSNTQITKAKGKIDLSGMYLTEEERRKLENKAETTRVAIEDLRQNPPEMDAQKEVEEDWLNLFARLAEDKTSKELQGLFGRILAGEIRKPGSFSLRTIQFISTLSKQEAESVSNFLSYALSGTFVVSFFTAEKGPSIQIRALMEELSLASSFSNFSGLVWNTLVPPQTKFLHPGTKFGIVIENLTDHPVKFEIECQILSTPAKEMIGIANPASTNLEYLKAAASLIFEKIRTQHADELLAGKIGVLVVSYETTADGKYKYGVLHKTTLPVPT